ncbi:glycosyltransferase family 61 protein [Entomobacter blattae]|uniref:Glycosyltransferase 61 catalytic domain-containing protein n=1 Tax=Entomobacter blattae TaxID=2762277 RepID=A0A7H1NR97_9PROT|nr:glycosyltransferase family 61 protein [Entomobacter blattae]QNT78307.1 hypothetical protein JGUZn3_10790 [Entomobacter blattae]
MVIRMFHLLSQNRKDITLVKSFHEQPALTFPSLAVGAASMAIMGLQDQAQQDRLPYHAPHTLLLLNATLCSPAGIIALEDGQILQDTLDHTMPEREGYTRTPEGKSVLPPSHVTLPGLWFSLLLGNSENIFHFLIMNLSRLCLLDEKDKRQLQGILLPAELPVPMQEATKMALAATFGAALPPLYRISKGESVKVEKLLLGWNMLSHLEPSVRALLFLKDMAKPLPQPLPGKKLYIDRQESAMRPLLNEGELAKTLKTFGFECIKLEQLSFSEQIRHFAEASLILAPHGAGNTHIVFCAPGTLLIEIMPDKLLNWCYRSMAELLGLRYDCIISRSLANSEIPPTFAPHQVAIIHVLGAIHHYLAL